MWTWMPHPSSAMRARLIWIGSLAFALALGVFLGAFAEYAVGVDHPMASAPIKVNYCVLFSHEDLYRGQPVETDAHYMQGIEGSGIGKDECPEYTAAFSGPPENDPIGRKWDLDLEKQSPVNEFDISFVGVIPAYPRYRLWYRDALNLWRPTVHIPGIRIEKLTGFQRTR